MITVNVYDDGTSAQGVVALDDISDVLKRPDELLWIDVLEPSADDLSLIRNEFGFHQLALEDVAKPRQRPKVDFYDDVLLIFFYAIETAELEEEPSLTQIGIFVGRNFVVTVHDRPVAALDDTCDRWRNNDQLVEHRPGTKNELLLYAILDAIVDSYFPLLDGISDRLDMLEDRIVQRFDTTTQKEIFKLKKLLVAIRRVVAPERDVLNVLLRRDSPVFDVNMTPYFQDVYDHVLRVTDAVDTYRDLLTSALEFQLSVASNRLNQVMKTLTASSIVLMSMTLIASIYGMNFDHMPELHWDLGYLWALGLMTTIGAATITLFRRIDWL